jgi:hypothetical protein
VRVLGDGQIAVANGKGQGSYPNPRGPNPSREIAYVHQGDVKVRTDQYVASLQTGTISFIAPPSDEVLGHFTDIVLANSPYRDDLIYGNIGDERQTYFASTPQHASPIQHAIYIIKENRTYDQVLGDMPKGNGDKSLTLFGEQVTPNLHKLANDYVLYDNFFENSDVSADGHNWASAAIAPDYTVKMWPSEYAHRVKVYGFEGGEPANTPPAGYLWGNALQAGLTVRDYGEWVSNLKKPDGDRQIEKANDPSLGANVDMNFRSFDLGYSDVDRAREFVREWKAFSEKGDAPNLSIVRLGNDHTAGIKAGALTPFALNADNDYAVGFLVDAVSHSKLWASTAIFIIEDDAQNGPDHVDSHRAPAWVISPYTRRGSVDSAMYNQMSLLRTIELLLGMRPLTQFDAGATPMFRSFSQTADTEPYSVVEPKVSLTDRNASSAPGASASARMDFDDADRVDDLQLNAVLWRAIKNTEPPPPVSSRFVR